MPQPAKKKGRRFGALLLSIGILGTVFASGATTSIAATEPDKGNILEYGSVPTSSDVASSKYAVIAQFKKGISERIITGVTTQKADNGRDIIVDPSDDLKGKIKVLYTNVASYNGRTLDFEYVVTDWKKSHFLGGEWMHFYDTHLGFSEAGYDYVSLQGTFKYADTGKDATDLTGSYMTVNDFDSHQFLSFDSEMVKKIDKVYAYEDSFVSYWKTGSKTNIGANFWQATDEDDRRAYATFLFSGYQINFDWNKDWDKTTSNNNPYNFNKVLNWKDMEHTQYFAYLAEKPVRTEVLAPFKKIINKSGEPVDSNEITVPDTYTYEIYHTVPAEYEEFFYKSYVMEDKIHESLTIDSAKVYDNENKDVTSKFTISTSGNTVKATANSTAISDKGFYGQDYRLEIKVSVKDSDKLIDFSGGDESFDVPNKATVTVDGKSKYTNEVKTKINLPQTEVTMKKLQIYTNKASSGLPATVTLDTKNVFAANRNQTVDVELYRTGSSKELMAKKTVTVKEASDPVELKIPADKLAKDKKENYEAVIKSNSKVVNVPDDAKAVDTDGYTAKEGTLTEANAASAGQPVIYKGVVMTERELAKDMKLYYETLNIDYHAKQNVKSGYEFDLYGKVTYTNEIMSDVTSKINIKRVSDAVMTTDMELIDKTLSYYKDNSDTTDISLLKKDKADKEKESVVTYQAPPIFMEQISGDTYTEQQKANGEIKNAAVDAGNKLYVPIWIDELGAYNQTLKSKEALGSNFMGFAIKGVVDVTAYMYNYADSSTADQDELLIHPMSQDDDIFGW